MGSMLSGLFGNGDDPEQQRAKADDFVNRVETGDPTEGFSDEEAIRNYSAVAGRLSPNELEEAATDALQRFTPEQRREFAGLLEKHGAATGDVNPEDPRQLAHLTSQLQSQSPDGLVGLLGGGGLDGILGGLLGGGGSGSGQGGGGGLVNDLLGGLFGGGDQQESGRRPSGGSAGQAGSINDLLDSPIAKAILAAIAAMAMKKFMGGGGGIPSFGGGDGGSRGGGDSRSGLERDNDPFQSGGTRRLSDTEGAPRRSGGLKGAEGKEA